MRILFLSALMTVTVGCSAQKTDTDLSKTEQSKTSSPRGIIGQTTVDIGELKDGEQTTQSDIKLDATPVIGALNSYGPILEQLSKGQIRQSLEFYRAEHGDYPKSHDQFMTGVIKAYKIKLPVLPANRQYKYDVANHRLVVVDGN